MDPFPTRNLKCGKNHTSDMYIEEHVSLNFLKYIFRIAHELDCSSLGLHHRGGGGGGISLDFVVGSDADTVTVTALGVGMVADACACSTAFMA